MFIFVFGASLVALVVATFILGIHDFGVVFVVTGKSPLKLTTTQAQELLVSVLESSNLARNWSYKYTHEQHLLGQNHGLVEWTQAKFKEYGLKHVRTEPYDVYINEPEDHALRLLDSDFSVIYEALLKEDVLAEDPTSGGDTVPTFHGYSASGNVTSTYFYANYGRVLDFAKLHELGLNMTGKIAIVRYGLIYRGLKVKFAQEHGVVGVVMYSDPGDDGEFTPQNGYKQYPHGPARQESSVERGSVMYLSYGPGDPTTPGYASKPGVNRTDPYVTTPRIPSLPVSYRDILPILEKINGTGVAASSLGPDWVGKLPGYDYHIGLLAKKSPVSSPLLNLYNKQKYGIKRIENVLGEIPGLKREEVVVVGNHRDAWITGGAGDPNSGSAVILEIMRALQNATKAGFVPYRTILFASWDGEEPGLLGSTEWAEDHAKWVKNSVVAYLNLDSAVTGNTLLLQASPSLLTIMLQIAKAVQHPKGGSLYEHYDKGPFKGQVDILGSGSDYTVFLEHLGVPSFDLGFVCNPATDPIYQYHLNYDSFYWMETFTDPGFVYHNVISRYLGQIILGIAGPEYVPLDIARYASEIRGYFKDALKSIPMQWYHQKVVVGENTEDFTVLVKKTEAALDEMAKAAAKSQARQARAQDELFTSSTAFGRVKRVARLTLSNLRTSLMETMMLCDRGLNGRSWFRHLIYASGRYTGYAGQSLPGLREAIEDNLVDDAAFWIWELQRRAEGGIALLEL